MGVHWTIWTNSISTNHVVYQFLEVRWYMGNLSILTWIKVHYNQITFTVLEFFFLENYKSPLKVSYYIAKVSRCIAKLSIIGFCINAIIVGTSFFVKCEGHKNLSEILYHAFSTSCSPFWLRFYQTTTCRQERKVILNQVFRSRSC